MLLRAAGAFTAVFYGALVAGIPLAEGAEHLASPQQLHAAQDYLRLVVGSQIDSDIEEYRENPEIQSALRMLKDDLEKGKAVGMDFYDYITKTLIPTGQVRCKISNSHIGPGRFSTCLLPSSGLSQEKIYSVINSRDPDNIFLLSRSILSSPGIFPLYTFVVYGPCRQASGGVCVRLRVCMYDIWSCQHCIFCGVAGILVAGGAGGAPLKADVLAHPGF